MNWWRIKTDRPPDLPPSRTARLAWRMLVIIAVLVALALALIWQLFSKVGQIERLQHGARQLYSQAVTAGASPVTTPPGAPPATAVTSGVGPRGPGPTQAQIDLAVASYCAQRDGCRGVPSSGQVAAAVRAFCSAGACQGPRGTRGASGSPGRSGATGAPGAAGPSGAVGSGPTAEQVVTAVAAYCSAHGGCTGPVGEKGDTGETGPKGSTGRGVASIDCTGLGVDRLVIHYDDGTDQTVQCELTTPTSSGAPS